MNVLFVYYVPSGGVETLNRQRCRALRQYGVHCSCLYYSPGAGVQNSDDIPTVITKNDIEIKRIVEGGGFQAIVVVSDYVSLQRFRMLGYSGKLVLEIQGYGPMETARTELYKAIPYVNAYASAVLNPNTPHIAALFEQYYPFTPKFHYPNCLDTQSFGYRPLPQAKHPIAAWIGRIEDNKNWREFLHIGHRLVHTYDAKLQLWMFEDANLAIPDERAQFVETVKRLKLGSNLTIRSNVPNRKMADYLSVIGDSGGFLISTSKVEGAPYAILEAMSCRCPVLTTDSDGVSTSVYHNTTGKYYARGDIDGAVREAVQLMDDAGLRGHIRAAAQLHVQRSFSPEAYCGNFIRMLESV